MNDLISLQCEKYCLGGLMKHPEIFPEIDAWVKEDTFGQSTHKVIWSILKQSLLKNESVTPTLVAQKISNLNIKTKDDISIFDYLNAISFSQITSKGTIDNFKELVKLAVLRELVLSSDKAKKFVLENKNKELKEIVSGVDGINNEKIVSLYKSVNDDFKNIFDDVESIVEDLGNNPPDPNKFIMGPFESVNRIYGSLWKPSNVTVVGARTGTGKSSILMYMNVFVAEKHDLPLLWLDFGEMTEREMQLRAVCMLTKGEVPLHSIETGQWRQNTEWTEKVRGCWDRVKKIKFYFQDISALGPQEIISLIRRFSYNKVGRENPFIAVYDYYKPFETGDYHCPEWKQMGHFLQDIKSFIKNEIPIPFFSAIQLNRSGTTTNKTADQIDDSENAIGMSDRITQQSSHSFILRFKTMDEIAVEENRFGNMKLINVKPRHLGKDYLDALRPVKIGKRYLRNHINIDGRSFYYEDRGDLNHAAKIIKEQYELLEEGEKDKTL